MDDIERLVEKLYKDHSSRILATLVRLFGVRNLEMAEDVLQEAFRKALTAWREGGLPENPAAWITVASKRHAIDTIRAFKTQRRFSDDIAEQLESGWTRVHTVEREFDEARIVDHQLRMIFMCANADISPEYRLPLMLRTLCGFGIPAVARALLLSEATVKKRLVRTREKLRGHAFEFPSRERLGSVMDSVHTTLYLLFNEGFHSSDETRVMNVELCREAIHLTSLLLDEPRVVNRDTVGLFALMQFHLARAASRIDEHGVEVPLDLQDRSRWDVTAIDMAQGWLDVAGRLPPGASDRFFIEAKIAERHCLAKTFGDTDWAEIVRWHDVLVNVTGSPLAALNRAIAMGHLGEIETAMADVARIREHDVFRQSYLPAAALAHLAALAGDGVNASRHADEACRLGASPREQRALHSQLRRLLGERLESKSRADAPP